MPRSIQNRQGLTIRKLIQNTNTYFRNRFEYKERDVVKRIEIRKISVFDLSLSKQRTTFEIRSSSYPQYYPYYTKRDSRGRRRSYQRRYKHTYDVILQMDELSIDTDRFKIRTGRDAKWDFSPKGRSKKNRRGRVVEGTNINREINGDHFFMLSYIRHEAGILFGRNYANGPPVRKNPNKIQFLTKHELNVIEILMNRGILK